MEERKNLEFAMGMPDNQFNIYMRYSEKGKTVLVDAHNPSKPSSTLGCTLNKEQFLSWYEAFTKIRDQMSLE